MLFTCMYVAYSLMKVQSFVHYLQYTAYPVLHAGMEAIPAWKWVRSGDEMHAWICL